MQNCEIVDVTSIMPWNPQTLNDDEEMHETECAELKDKSNERRINLKMKKHDHIKQNQKKLQPISFIYLKKCCKRHWHAPHNLETFMEAFQCKFITKAEIPSCKGEESMKIVLQIPGSPQPQVVKVTMELKHSLESNQNTCLTMDSKLNQKVQIVY